jgi:hypothetical protein
LVILSTDERSLDPSYPYFDISINATWTVPLRMCDTAWYEIQWGGITFSLEKDAYVIDDAGVATLTRPLVLSNIDVVNSSSFAFQVYTNSDEAGPSPSVGHFM